MTVTIDAKKILEDVEKQGDRTKVSFYLSKSLYENFKRTAGSRPASQVLQKLMEIFVQDADGRTKGKHY